MHIETEECEIANLNYWAYWLGEISDPQLSDTFMVELDLDTWRGDRMLAHVAAKLDPANIFIDVVVHTLWSLITRLLDENAVSGQSSKELQEVLYALRMIRRR